MSSTNFCFEPGRLTFLMDSQAGSSGKAKTATYITENSDNWQFCCNAFSAQAGHWSRGVKNSDRDYFYQTFNSCAYDHEKFEKMYIGHGSCIELPALLRELEENGVPPHKLGISPIAAIIQDIDGAFERGEVDLDGNKAEGHLGTMKSGSTCHGVGACKARKILRRPNIKLARDVPELREFMCDVPGEIMNRLDSGQAGLLEIAQGFQLSYGLPEFYPYCTSRNCTVMAALDDMMVPPKYAGNVILNYRTFPIRINNKKFIGEDGKHLTWDEVENGVPHEVKEYNSGPGYDDQVEISWDDLTEMSGSPEKIIELTSVTKLPRRAFTFSAKNMKDSIRCNDTGHRIFISINFINYVDHNMSGKQDASDITDKAKKWLEENVIPNCGGAILKFLGTGAKTHEMICL